MPSNSKNSDLQAQTDQPQTDQPQQTDQKTQIVPMPAGGLYALAQQLYPANAGDAEKMKEAVHELWLLNTDTLRSEDVHIIGQVVRIPA